MSRHQVYRSNDPSPRERMWKTVFLCSLALSLLLFIPFFYRKSIFQGDAAQLLILLFVLLTAAWTFTAVSFVRFLILRGKRLEEEQSDRRFRRAVGEGSFGFALRIIAALIFCFAAVVFFGYLMEELCFPSVQSSGVYRAEMRTYFRKEITLWALIFLLAGLICGLILHFGRRKLLPPWMYLILLLAVPLLLFAGKDIGEITADVQNESYVVYHGAYRQWYTYGRRSTYHTDLLDGDKEIRLRSPGHLTKDGTFSGYVVYAERSEYVVYVGETLPGNP